MTPVPLAFYSAPDQFFREMVSIALGCVNQINAEIRGLSEHGVNLALLECLAPFSAELARADTDDGDRHCCLSQLAIFHETCSVLSMLCILESSYIEEF